MSAVVVAGSSGGPDAAAIAEMAATAPHNLSGAEELRLLVDAGIAVALALAAAVVLAVLVRQVGRRSTVVTDVARRARRPLRALLVVLALRQVAVGSVGTDDWLDVVRFVLTAALITTVAWLLATVASVAEDVVLRRYRDDDDRHGRRVRTQVNFLRRLVVALIIVVAVASVLLTVPAVQAVGTGLLASAGLISVVAGLAAQSTLTNVFAGLQLALTDAIRVDDVVVVEKQFGKVEEITMAYIVVRLWDERTMVIPSTYFTTTPFENWTRRDSQLIGTVLIDVDWRTDFDAMRAELARVLADDELWDGRVGVLQVTEAVGSVVQVRALVSAADAPTVFDLRCHVREALVRWLVTADPSGLPRLRQENIAEPQAGSPAPGAGGALRRDSLFTGSSEAAARSRDFHGPSEADQLARARADASSRTRQVTEAVSTRGAAGVAVPAAAAPLTPGPAMAAPLVVAPASPPAPSPPAPPPLAQPPAGFLRAAETTVLRVERPDPEWALEGELSRTSPLPPLGPDEEAVEAAPPEERR